MENDSLMGEKSAGNKGTKRGVGAGAKKSKGGKKRKAGVAATEGEASTDFIADQDTPRVTVSTFDYNVDNYFRAVDTISKLCGEEGEAVNASEVERLSTMIIFLREWKHYYYKPRIIKFTCGTEKLQQKDVVNGINLPQFSSATVPKMERLSDDMNFIESSKDFILYVGGPVWALDWCPRLHRSSDCHINCEYLAVAAHPPEASYHKIGVPLTGRGVIQIWCILNQNVKDEVVTPLNKAKGRPGKPNVLKDESSALKKPKGRPRKTNVTKDESPALNKSRGRHRKKEAEKELDDLESNSQFIPALAVEFPEDSHEFHAVNKVNKSNDEQPLLDNCIADSGLEAETREHFSSGISACKSGFSTSQRRRKKDKARAGENLVAVVEENNSSEQGLLASDKNTTNNGLGNNSHLPKDVTLPRVVLCLAHNGKVAWDVKWRPLNDSGYKNSMGYLAVLLGNGSLEVWDVPLPNTIKVLYSSCRKDGTDPRFVKLEPVFRCSKLKCGDRQSIPLTMEWSPSAPHDLILAGCHDGTVALWKFFPGGSSQDTRPLLCFSADTVPIRALSWAPDESDAEGANVIVTAGHGSLRFWDLRDPYRPLWEINSVRRVVYSLDWLLDPRCIILAYDDGTLRILSLSKAAYDVPVTGKPFSGTQQQGLHSYYCSSFTIWSVHVSRLTGMVAYCNADGTVLHFQLTAKAVDKDPSRNKTPHFLCGSLTEDDSTLSVNTPLPCTPFPMKKSLNEWGDTPRSIRGILSGSNQAKKANDEVLALCYGDDPEPGFGYDNSPANPNRRTQKPNTCKKKKLGSDLACSAEEELGNLQRGGNEKSAAMSEIEIFPPKIIAMHRVRWNMNKGSGRLLCYGGAAGIVRCQDIAASCIAERSNNKFKRP
ncbi:PREDICTED: uncharacterized protein LOC104586906 isoform X2 [Nelumbo nucifera]|uniref:Uncharacterized protein LOC104586906 isoform X2 n=1 Tax=Nelumbo nucifera TaxID=4432 RepID=A0A1U7YTV1_NELNU|nr:PREDICTED: uncharacterized protein LOC104586906 isoform X2 [Nelumbo nucifera]